MTPRFPHDRRACQFAGATSVRACRVAAGIRKGVEQAW
jgi:hypothetical protein